MSQARRAAGIRRVNTPSTDSEEDIPITSTSASSRLPLTDTRPPLIDNRPPLRPATVQPQSLAPDYNHPANGPVLSPVSSKSPYGCKDYPVGYAPTPRPLSPPISQSTSTLYAPRPSAPVSPAQLADAVSPNPSRIGTSSSYHHQSRAQFVKSVPPPTSSTQNPPRTTSRLEERVRAGAIRVDEFYGLQVPDQISDENSWYTSAHEEPTTYAYERKNKKRTASHGGGGERGVSHDHHRARKPLLVGTESDPDDNSSPSIILPDFLKNDPRFRNKPGYRFAEERDSRRESSRTRTNNNQPSPYSQASSTTRQSSKSKSKSRERTQLLTSPHHHSSSSHSQKFKPTRKGYWNKRGDRMLDNGQIIPVTRSQAYPPELSHYPEFAFINEVGASRLPDVEEDRVSTWCSSQAHQARK